MATRGNWVVVLLAVTLLASPGQAFYEKEGENASVDLMGSGRLTAAFMHQYDGMPFEDDGLAIGEMRFLVASHFGDHFKLEFNGFADMSRMPPGGGLGGAFSTAGTFRSPSRSSYLQWEYWDDGAVVGRLGVDRLVAHWDYDAVRVSLGRMPINYSVTQIFTVNDFFAPFSPTTINTVYKPGVDSLRVSFAPGPLSNVEVIGVLGSNMDDELSWTQSSVVLRAQTVWQNFEWGILGGKIPERYMVGASLQGEAGPLSVRGEGHVGFPEDSDKDIYFRVTGGVDTSFVWRNASVGAEYMFLSDGESDANQYLTKITTGLFPDDIGFLGKHYTGLTAGLDLMPILRFQVLGMLNASDGSGIASLFLSYSISDEAEALLGCMIPWGKQSTFVFDDQGEVQSVVFGSEYGFMPLTAFLETRFYF